MEWRGRKCELVNHIGKMIVEGRIVTCDPKKLILDNNLGEIDVGVTILSCANDRSQIMSIWRWPLSQTIIDGHCLLSFLIAYDEHHVSKEDKGVVSAHLKQKIKHFFKEKTKRIKR